MGTKIEVLDRGFVELVDSMGDDLDIVNAARQSFNSPVETEMNEKNTKRLLSMLRRGHTSPFEMVEFKFRVKCPIFVARQWMRHRTASYNETSLRYTKAEPEFYIPSAEREKSQWIRDQIEGSYEVSMGIYKYLLDEGASPEVARIVLPVGLYTSFVFKIDLHNLLHFLDLRTANGAQWEIRQYANAIVELIRPIVPVTIAEKYGAV